MWCQIIQLLAEMRTCAGLKKACAISRTQLPEHLSRNHPPSPMKTWGVLAEYTLREANA